MCSCRPAYIVYLSLLGVFVFGSYIVYLQGKTIVRCELFHACAGMLLPCSNGMAVLVPGKQAVVRRSG